MDILLAYVIEVANYTCSYYFRLKQLLNCYSCMLQSSEFTDNVKYGELVFEVRYYYILNI